MQSAEWILLSPSIAREGYIQLEYPDGSIDNVAGSLMNAVAWFLEGYEPSDVYAITSSPSGRGVVIYYRKPK